jgi:hypothetical protein
MKFVNWTLQEKERMLELDNPQFKLSRKEIANIINSEFHNGNKIRTKANVQYRIEQIQKAAKLLETTE